MDIAPRAGRLGSGAYFDGATPIEGDPFGDEHRDYSPFEVEGGLKMPDNRTLTLYAHPQQGRRNVTKQEVFAPATIFYTEQVSVGEAPNIQPHEKGTFFALKHASLGATKFGAAGSETSDTAFHRNPRRELPRPVPRSAIDTAHVFAVSFHSQNNLWGDKNNSFLGGVRSPSTGRIGVGRWNIEKKGVV